MKVARHEVPGTCADMIRPGGNGLSRGTELCLTSKTIRRPNRPIIPYPSAVAILAMADKTGRNSRCRIPGISCLAIFIRSLRDSARASLIAEHSGTRFQPAQSP
jgi:hypothetical protein